MNPTVHYSTVVTTTQAVPIGATKSNLIVERLSPTQLSIQSCAQVDQSLMLRDTKQFRKDLELFKRRVAKLVGVDKKRVMVEVRNFSPREEDE